MNAKKDQASDPARSLALLWGSHSKPGRSGLTLGAIINAGIELADAGGLEAVSMRQVADRLGVGTMSLYTHVPGKSDLTDLMIDTASGEVYTSETEPVKKCSGWREGLQYIASRNWELYLQHPWLLQAPMVRPVLGPNITLKYEYELRPLDGSGLTDVEMDATLTLILTHVQATARMQIGMDLAQREAGNTDLQWWEEHAPLLDKLMDGSKFPLAGRVGEAFGQEFQASSSPSHALDYGLETILDGIAARINSRHPPH